MKKILMSLVLVTALFGDCDQLLTNAKAEFNEADKRWGGEAGMASHYSNKGTQEYVQYIECMNVKRHNELKELLKRVPKVNGNTELKYKTESFGTGY